MKTILENFFFQIEIEKSKFLGYAIAINNEEDAKNEINKIKKEHPKATHHCYAYVLKDKQKSNDDGEPAGTAGIPILEIIKQFDLENVLIVVVRYFGGIKLGAGGLVRAYARSAKEVLLISKIHEIKTLPTYNLILPKSTSQMCVHTLFKKWRSCDTINTVFSKFSKKEQKRMLEEL